MSTCTCIQPPHEIKHLLAFFSVISILAVRLFCNRQSVPHTQFMIEAYLKEFRTNAQTNTIYLQQQKHKFTCALFNRTVLLLRMRACGVLSDTNERKARGELLRLGKWYQKSVKCSWNSKGLGRVGLRCAPTVLPVVSINKAGIAYFASDGVLFNCVELPRIVWNFIERVSVTSSCAKSLPLEYHQFIAYVPQHTKSI